MKTNEKRNALKNEVENKNEINTLNEKELTHVAGGGNIDVHEQAALNPTGFTDSDDYIHRLTYEQ